MKLFTLVAIALIMNGCATIPEKAMKIQVHSQVSSLLTDCKKIRPVDGTASSMLSPEQAISEAKVTMREKTADLGGDTVAILNTDITTSVTSWTAYVQGVALTCYR